MHSRSTTVSALQVSFDQITSYEALPRRRWHYQPLAPEVQAKGPRPSCHFHKCLLLFSEPLGRGLDAVLMRFRGRGERSQQAERSYMGHSENLVVGECLKMAVTLTEGCGRTKATAWAQDLAL